MANLKLPKFTVRNFFIIVFLLCALFIVGLVVKISVKKSLARLSVQPANACWDMQSSESVGDGCNASSSDSAGSEGASSGESGEGGGEGGG